MKTLKKSRVVFAFVLLTLFFSISVSNVAALIKENSLRDLTNDSDNIITGKVLSQESYWENGNIFTNVTVLVNERVKGSPGNQVVVKVQGGTVGDIYAEVSDVALFNDNEEVFLFLKGNSVVGWNQGKYSIQNNTIKETGEPLVEFVNNIEQNLGIGISDGTGVGNGTGVVDGAGVGNGRFDNLTKLKSVTSDILSIAPHITNVTPGSGPAIADELGSEIASADSTQITISGSAFGPINGIVKFWSVGTIQYDASIVSWTDTKIVAKVPGKVSSGTRSGGYGNVRIFSSDGTPSDNYGNFGVTYSYGGGKWPGNKVIYRVNSNAGDTANELSAIQAAIDTWNSAGADFKFVYGGQTSKTDVAMDGENSVMWVNYDTGSVATTTTWWSGADTKSIIECDIVFNNASVAWATDSSSEKMDIQTTATHEFGHWLQLLDLYGSIDRQKMMYGYVNNGQIKRTLSTDDIAGIEKIYGLGTPPQTPVPTVSPTLVPTVSPTLVPNVAKGDVSGDAQVNIIDALFIAQYTVGARTLSPSQLATADVSCNGVTDIVDTLFIAQYTVGLRPLLSTCN